MFAAPTMRSDPQSGMLPNLTNHTKQSREAFRDSFYVVRFFCGVLMPGARTESARLALSGISLVMNLKGDSAPGSCVTPVVRNRLTLDRILRLAARFVEMTILQSPSEGRFAMVARHTLPKANNRQILPQPKNNLSRSLACIYDVSYHCKKICIRIGTRLALSNST